MTDRISSSKLGSRWSEFLALLRAPTGKLLAVLTVLTLAAVGAGARRSPTADQVATVSSGHEQMRAHSLSSLYGDDAARFLTSCSDTQVVVLLIALLAMPVSVLLLGSGVSRHRLLAIEGAATLRINVVSVGRGCLNLLAASFTYLVVLMAGAAVVAVVFEGHPLASAINWGGTQLVLLAPLAALYAGLALSMSTLFRSRIGAVSAGLAIILLLGVIGHSAKLMMPISTLRSLFPVGIEASLLSGSLQGLAFGVAVSVAWALAWLAASFAALAWRSYGRS